MIFAWGKSGVEVRSKKAPELTEVDSADIRITELRDSISLWELVRGATDKSVTNNIHAWSTRRNTEELLKVPLSFIVVTSTHLSMKL